MPWTVELAYPSVGALRAEIDTQLGEGALHVDAEVPEELPDHGELLLRLTAPDEEPIEVTVQIGDRGADSIYVEVHEATGRMLRERAQRWPAAAAEPPQVSFFEPSAAGPNVEQSVAQRVSVMSVGEKIQAASQGARDLRAALARDRAGPIQCAIIRNPRVTIDEITALARGPTLAPDAAEALSQHPTFSSSPAIVFALVRNPRTPLPIATQLVARLSPNDLRTVAKGTAVRAQVAAAARKRLNA